MAIKVYVKNLKDFSVVAFSWNPLFKSISFKPQEVRDCSGIELDEKQDTFALFYKTYVETNILTMIYIPVTGSTPIIILGEEYFDFGYVDYGWVV